MVTASEDRRNRFYLRIYGPASRSTTKFIKSNEPSEKAQQDSQSTTSICLQLLAKISPAAYSRASARSSEEKVAISRHKLRLNFFPFLWGRAFILRIQEISLAEIEISIRLPERKLIFIPINYLFPAPNRFPNSST